MRHSITFETSTGQSEEVVAQGDMLFYVENQIGASDRADIVVRVFWGGEFRTVWANNTDAFLMTVIKMNPGTRFKIAISGTGFNSKSIVRAEWYVSRR